MGAAAWMEDHAQILKSDAYTLSGLARLDDEACFLKLYRYKSPLHRILFALGIARPLRDFTAARELGAQGVSVPRPLACLNVSDGMLLVIEGLSGGGDLAELWLRQPGDDDSRVMMRSAGENLAVLHSAGYAHGDCKWNNLFWDGFRVFLIDLDKARRAALHSSVQARDLARFTVNAEKLKIGPQLYEEFLGAYLQGVGGDRREVVQRMLPILVRFRKKYLVRHGPRGQRLV